MSCKIDQSTQRFYVGWFHVGWQGIGDQSDALAQNACFRCTLCAAISGEISILIQTGAESWERFPVPRICRWESTTQQVHNLFINRPCRLFSPKLDFHCLQWASPTQTVLNMIRRLCRLLHPYVYSSTSPYYMYMTSPTGP